jgi:Spy/CpxP family protein refolding chaperone
MRVATGVLTLVVSLTMVGSLWAAEEKTCPEGKQHRHPTAEHGQIPMLDMLKCLNLTEDQKAKVGELKKEYQPKFAASWQKVEGIWTADQKKARQEAIKAARAAGKSREESWKDVKAAVKATDEQKAKMAETRKEGDALRKEFRGKVMAVLTPEQQAQLKKELKQKRQHSAEGK